MKKLLFALALLVLTFSLCGCFTDFFESIDQLLKPAREEKKTDEERETRVDRSKNVPEGKKYFKIDTLKFSFYYPEEWKVQILTEDEKDYEISFQLPTEKTTIEMLIEYDPSLRSIEEWEGGRYLRKMGANSEIDLDINDLSMLVVDGFLEGGEQVRIAVFNKYGYFYELSLRGMTDYFKPYEKDFNELYESVFIERKYDVQI